MHLKGFQPVFESNACIIEGSIYKAIQIILISIGFVLLGFFLVSEEIYWGWPIVVIFGLGIPIGFFQFFRKPYIKLDTEGFYFYSGVKLWRYSWCDIDSFFVGKIHGSKMIGINYSDSYQKTNTARKIALGLAGMEGTLPNQFKLNLELVCEHLNSWKQEHLQKNNELVCKP